ncbi:MAG: PilX N-terminal domain-containing pilus assembly protein [Thiobacillus sp.]
MKTTTLYKPRTERGVALITGLIFMVVLTLFSMAAMRTTLLEERMAGNARDIDLAFQAAEAALRAGEQVLNGASLPTFGATGAYLSSAGVSTRGYDLYWTQTHDWSADSAALSTVPTGAYSAPRYVIEQLPAVAGAGFSLKAGPVAETGVFRITTRGTGGNSNTLIYLQETYRR